MRERLSPPLAVLLAAAVLFGLAGCGGGSDAGPDPQPCTEEAVTLTQTTTASYACGDPYRAVVRIHNGACKTLKVTKLEIVSQVTACNVATCVASCATPAGSTTGLCPYPLAVTVPSKATGTVIDLTGDGYHYPSGGLQMTERYTYQVSYTLDGQALSLSSDPVDVTVSLPQPCP
ncbi:MAG: hypothetical protein U0229_09725 [Anaeromyxobacter sp.]